MEIEKIREIRNKTILVFGDYMVDKYILGNVDRISPEAPIPIIEIKNEQNKLGGAGNVINNLISLGVNVRAIGGIGNDLAGNFIYNSFLNSGVDVNYIKKYQELKTIVKTRVVSNKQQLIRIDEEEKRDLPNEYYTYIEENITNILKNISVVIISDYAKGAVNKEFCQLLITNAKKFNIPVIIDPKGKDYNKYKNATLCTPNMKELNDVSKINIKTEEEIFKYSQKLIKELGLSYMLITRSEDGISLVSKNDKKDFPAIKKEVIDVSGAGDTVVATIASLMAIKINIDEICQLANIAASVVISKFGTSTLTLDEMISSIYGNTRFKLIDKTTAKYIVNELKEKGKKIVFTNGCFDLLHVGHLSSFKQAKTFGDILIVAINSDSSIKENKGDLRPIIKEEDRIEMLCALEIIDYVILMEEKTPESLISILEPHVCVKGEDWKNKEVPEKKIIDLYGGQLEFIKLKNNNSTTNIINKIQKMKTNNK